MLICFRDSCRARVSLTLTWTVMTVALRWWEAALLPATQSISYHLELLLRRERILQQIWMKVSISYSIIIITQNKGKLLPKIEEITVGQAHENLIEIFQWIRPSFSIRRERMYVNTRQRLITCRKFL